MSKFWPLIKFLPEKTNLEFVGFAKYAAGLSVVAVIGSIFLTLYPFTPPCGGLNCGIDFTGGIGMQITSPRTLDLDQVRSTIRGVAAGDVGVQEAGTPREAMIRIENAPGVQPAQLATRVQSALKQAVGQDVTFGSTEVISGKVSEELLTGGAMALVIAVALMLVYIWFRFEWQFALGAVAGLLHDTILVFGLFAVTQMEFTLTGVAAILTVIGYSMNDTVVVFDRLRENLRKYKKMPLKNVINLTINETLSRTIITGVTALMALAALAVLGGETLFPFSIALMFGIVFGTYSSIYVGAPIILLWGVKRGREAPSDVKQVVQP